jgi:sugar phosphate isomerase/epimerase
VSAPGLGLHLDTGAMALAGEDPAEALPAARSLLDHVHVSEPNLAPIAPARIDHGRIGRTLRHMNYDGWIAIEMRRVEDAVSALARSIDLVRANYSEGACLESSANTTAEAVA